MRRLSSLIRERRSVVVAGRRYRVRAPTVATVELLIELFPREIHACVAGWKAAGDVVQLLASASFVPLFVARAVDFGRVLETCVDGDGPSGAWPLTELAVMVLDLCDAPGIAAALGLGDETAQRSGAERQAEAVVNMAKRFHCSPFDVMDWPYEGFLAVCDAEIAAAQVDALRRQGCSEAYIQAMREAVN